MIEHAIRCIGMGRPCGRPVHPTIGGAWCKQCRPVDMTGGVSPWDSPRARSSRGGVAVLRGARGTLTPRLLAAGWVPSATRRSPDGPWWRDPITGETVTQTTASTRYRQRIAGDLPGRRGRPGVASPSEAQQWVADIAAGIESARTIAERRGISVNAVTRRIAKALRGAA